MAEFTTRLAVDLTASDEVVVVESNEGARTTYEWRAVIDDEVVYVFSGVAEGLVWGIHRGADDTDPAEHPAGSFLTGVRVGQIESDEPLLADDLVPTEVLTTEDETDWLRSDPVIEGV